MKSNSKQIQASLHELETISTAAYPKPANTHTHPQTGSRTYSFEIHAAKRNASEKTVYEGTFFSSTSYEQPVARQSSDKLPMLPKFEPCRDATPRVSIFSQNQIAFAASEAEIQQIVRQIQDIYLEGPLVDGWLESHPQTSQLGEQVIGYRLYGLDASGRMWSYPCPVNQLASVSMAIARYQKLQQLLERKHYLDAVKLQVRGYTQENVDCLSQMSQDI